ncbi:transcription elongation factor GreA [Endozoicomonas sp. G2_2]|uniref:transcription elongation factor GreA n=1 Tax=Gammaproteobacteria TaxID=1236 RepID=UPI000C539333|nr:MULTISPECIES: transcription elongation factor GreA [Gammaproteobacteria]MAS10805.1 transcription elongation factor GreA [Salinisphaera sp.]MBO9470240.1 transcription elongation factor GreA [Endozoicomonas sp. G2_2]|tara:strand:+ start:293 stop:775 length:483 start_codon:yes stop_codon:yes gene_type:complete
MDKTPLTQNGADALRDELKRLKKTERPRIVAAIEEARAHGDLKENAEYHAAKEEQGFNEGRINEIESKLATAQIIDVARAGAQANGRVIFGATLELADEDTGEELTYQIVGEDEADIKNGLLSFASPIARALIGKTEGDVVDVDVPGGRRTLEIVTVRYV